MQCLSPVKRVVVKEDGKHLVTFPCGHCEACQENYKNDWAVRVKHELSCHKESVFITLTYSDLHLSLQNLEYGRDRFNSLEKEELSLFIKRLRRSIEPLKIRFFASGEYGEKCTERPHYHVLIFGLSKDHDIFKNKVPVYRGGQIKYYYLNTPLWPHGHIEVSARIPDEKSAQYIAKYVAKKKGVSDKDYYKLRKILPEFLLMSRRPGIGYLGIKKHSDFYKSHPYGRIGSFKVKLPRYVLDKVEQFTDFDLRGQLNSDTRVYYTKNQKVVIRRKLYEKVKK